jgi:hypothetical protein
MVGFAPGWRASGHGATDGPQEAHAALLRELRRSPLEGGAEAFFLADLVELHVPTSVRAAPREYFRRNCWAAGEGSEPERGHRRAHRRRPDVHLHRLPALRLELPPRGGKFAEERAAGEIAGQIFLGGAGLYGFTDADFAKADAAAAKDPVTAEMLTRNR